MTNITIPACPICGMENTYPDGDNFICPDCSHDTVTLIKDLKVKGSSLVIKGGTKIKNIRLVDGDHDIDCKVDGQSMLLKSEFMKKA